jgi:hypothetical protein
MFQQVRADPVTDLLLIPGKPYAGNRFADNNISFIISSLFMYIFSSIHFH